MRLPAIPRGRRAFVVGRTGSGKTSGAAWLLSRSPGRWVILNVKYDSLLTRLGPDVPMDVGAIQKAQKNSRVVVVHPEMMDINTLDNFVWELAESKTQTGLVVDELLYLSKGNGQAGPGLMGWLTRGRARNQSFIGATQRPANVTNYMYSEADYYMLYDLKLPKDWAKIAEYTGRHDLQRERKDHTWAWYDVADDKKIEFRRVPYDDIVRRFG